MAPLSKPPAASPGSVADVGMLRSIVDALDQGLVALDLEGRVVLVNPMAEELLQLSEAAARGYPLDDVAPPGPALAELGRRVLGEGRAVHELQLLPSTPGRSIQAYVAPRFDGRGQVAGLVILLNHRDNQAPEVTAQTAERAALYATLVAGLAHEVRNPLGGIRGAAQLLEAELPSVSFLREHTRVILREVDRLSALVSRLLDLGRPAGPERSSLNLHQILDEVLALCLRDQGARDFMVTRQYDPSLPRVHGDSDGLARLFHNLVRNAGEATAWKGRLVLSTAVEMGVRLRLSESPDGRGARGLLKVTLADDGPGIPPELAGRLFVPFATGKREGTGLGLALARKVAVDHGGWISWSNRPGRGAVFSVYLPAEAP